MTEKITAHIIPMTGEQEAQIITAATATGRTLAEFVIDASIAAIESPFLEPESSESSINTALDPTTPISDLTPDQLRSFIMATAPLSKEVLDRRALAITAFNRHLIHTKVLPKFLATHKTHKQA